jgi:two-component system sensor histidine kinase SenX3
VLKATAPAYAWAGPRHALVDDELADLVRQVRRDGQIRETELLQPAPIGVPPRT